MTLLTVRPYYDKTTHYLWHWCNKFIKEFKDSLKIVDLEGKRAIEKLFKSVVKKIIPSIIIFNGHGDDTKIAGQDNETILGVNNNEELTIGKIIYAISCKSASRLGYSCVSKGATAFIGYLNDFIFLNDINSVNKPLDDKRAALFLEPSNKIMSSLAKGLSPREAHNQSRKMFFENIQYVLTKNRAESYLASYLFWDYRHQVCIDK